MNTGEAYITLTKNGNGNGAGAEKPSSLVSGEAHSFTPVVSEFAGERWRKGAEGIFTQVWPPGEVPHDESGFRIRVSVPPAAAIDALRTTLPIIVGAACPFKLIANSALLELAFSKWDPNEPAGDFMTVFPPSEAQFNDLTAKLQDAVRGIKPPHDPISTVEPNRRPPVTPDNPWPGTDFFLPEEAAYFFGFEDEKRDLSQRIERSTLTVLLGQKGVGKSSLIRAGLKPIFDQAHFEPIYLRLQNSGGAHPVQQVRDEINRVLTERKIDGAPFGEGQTLHEYFTSLQPGWLSADLKQVVPVLIFDQFEQFLALNGDDPAIVKAIEAFWTQFANLVENRGREIGRQLHLPSADFRAERNLFKVVISLRQDDLPKLLARRRQMPSLAQNQFILKPFNGRKGLPAVLGAGSVLLDKTNPAEIAEQIVRRVGGETTQPVEKPAQSAGGMEALESLRVDPSLLSFFCQQLAEASRRTRSGHAAPLITSDFVNAEAPRILEDFLQSRDQTRQAVAVPQAKAPAQATETLTAIQPVEPPAPIPLTETQTPVSISPPEIPVQLPEPPVTLQTTEAVADIEIKKPDVAVQVPVPGTEDLPPVKPAEPPAKILPPQPEAVVPALVDEVAIQPLQPEIAIQSTEAQVVAEAIEPIIAVQPTEPSATPSTAGQSTIVKATRPIITVQPAESQSTISATELAVESLPTEPPTAVQTLEPKLLTPPPEPPISIPAAIPEEHRRPEEAIPTAPKPASPPRTPLPDATQDYTLKRLRYVAMALGMLLVIILSVMVVTHYENLQQQQTEAELEEFISNLATAKSTFKSAHRQLMLAESDLALKESNLLVLTQLAREQETETSQAREQFAKLAGEQTNSQARIAELNTEKAQAEARLAQWSTLVGALTNRIATLTRQRDELEASNHRLAVTNAARPVVTTTPEVASLSVSRSAGTNTADEKESAAMQSPPERLLAPITPDTDSFSRRTADILLIHGQCLYSEAGAEFKPLLIRQVVHQGAIIKTGKLSWCDFFIRRSGVAVRVAPESAIKIARLSLGSQNGIPVVDTVLELSYGRIFTVVRALVPGSTLEISDASGHSVIEGGGLGSYMITAPRADSGERLSVASLRVVGQKDGGIIAPDQNYSAKDGAAFNLAASTWETTLIHLDELEAEADTAINSPEPPKR